MNQLHAVVTRDTASDATRAKLRQSRTAQATGLIARNHSEAQRYLRKAGSLAEALAAT